MEAVRFSGSGVVRRTSLLSFDGLRLSLVPFRIPSSVGACGVGLGQRSFRGLTVKAATVVAPKFLIPAGNMLRESTGLSFHWFFMASQKRTMTKSRRVQDRSKKKRVHDLEIATERSKVTSKVLVVIEALKREPEQVIPLKRLEQYRQQINLSKPHKVVHFIRKSPKLFELYRDKKGVIWCGLTKEAEDLVEEETRLLEEHSEKAVEYVTRLLMMSVNKRLSVDKIAHFRRDFGLPYDFRNRWIHMFPDHFKVVRIEDAEYLQLVSWNPAWAVTELEKKAMATGTISDISSESEVLFLPFPMKFPSNYKKLFRYGGKIEHFQKRSHLSPYADAKGLSPGSQEFDKRAVAIMHEILSFTIEKRLVTDHLTHFRREFVMPQKLMRLLLKHFGIFYVSERGKRLSVFLTEAYEGSELADKCPLVLWKEKILRFTGYRGRRKRIESFNEFSDVEGPLFDGDFDNQTTFMNLEDDEIDGTIDDSSLADDSEMKVGEVYDSYKD
ncbi:protein WHAT'S THIS FACTOR 1, chloroplastic-like isoform X2 [Phoenix dactylifera]|uniref:Protein WHAT'S THIS FACTOR 1, chloroplastic-like isoform X2 n=1 Tax=Phoenix dactylifera TaxID=42345 RepID=A0A8B9A911_PHODC|nr:protein WHAT'S THIS FACTOR 1, chloroplastic-like isoform X2 [Phoenix dactylifera]XP_038983120.1 protein WHAT'S THIS FACTOR 1, chloroplastic-like isoform X2 [Phoenix dactylifera]